MSGHPGWNSGDVITISRGGEKQLPADTFQPLEFLVDMKGKSSFSLAYKDKPYHRINITSSGDIEIRNCVGKNSFFLLEKCDDGGEHCSFRVKSACKIKTKSNKDKEALPKENEKQDEHFFLAFNFESNKLEVIAESVMLNSNLEASASINNDDHGCQYCTTFSMEVMRDFSYSKMPLRSSQAMRTPKVLQKWDKHRLVSEGYLHLPKIILPTKVLECAHLLMHSLGVPGSISAGGTQEGLGKLGGYLSNCEEIRSLLLHPETCKGPSLLSIIEELVGAVDLGSISGQIALRFPEYVQDSLLCSTTSSFLQLPDGSFPVGSAWHTDGLRQGKYHGFTLLVGVCLSDCLADFSGNLLLWPGSHVPIHKSLVGPHGGLDLDLLARLLLDDEQGASSAPAPTPAAGPAAGSGSCSGEAGKETPSVSNVQCNTKQSNNEGETNTNTIKYTDTDTCTDTGTDKDMKLHENAPRNLPSLGLPLSMHLCAGDVILLHPDTAHCGGPNFSSRIRNMIYFRIKRPDIRESDGQYREDMWADLPGVSS
jgi:hypothetical protein